MAPYLPDNTSKFDRINGINGGVKAFSSGRGRSGDYQFLYGARWRTARLRWLAKHPLCEECGRAGRLQAGEVVDHVQPHKGDKGLFWDRSNWQTLCKVCHDLKTAGEGIFK